MFFREADKKKKLIKPQDSSSTPTDAGPAEEHLFETKEKVKEELLESLVIVNRRLIDVSHTCASWQRTERGGHERSCIE